MPSNPHSSASTAALILRTSHNLVKEKLYKRGRRTVITPVTRRMKEMDKFFAKPLMAVNTLFTTALLIDSDSLADTEYTAFSSKP